MLALLLIVPLVLALIVVALLRSSTKTKYVALAGSIASLALLYFIPYGTTTIPWFTIGNFIFNITTTVAELNQLLLALVLGIGSVVMVYSFGYMRTLSEQRRFYAEMLAFEISMTVFAMSGNFILLFIAWEFLSLFSYLLIGFWYNRERAVRAARLAITIVLIGDLALLASMAIFFNIFGTLEFAGIIQAIGTQAGTALWFYSGSLLLLVAIFTKSAQFPFQEWLPDAMEGPTPVSAYLHSTTMVKAGVFTAIILFPIFYKSGLAQMMVIFGIITAILATLNAMREMHVKKVLAYSTIQELSLMLIAIGSGAIFAAIYFFVVQSFYKALIFFSSGSMMKATREETLDKMTGLKENKLLYYTTLIGVLSLAGFFPLSGFFATAGIDTSVLGNLGIYAIISLIGFATSFYIFRWFLLSSKPAKDHEVRINYLGASKSMVYTGAVLAGLTIVASLLFLNIDSFINQGATMETYLSTSAPLTIMITDSIIFMVLIIAGALIAYRVYKPSKKARPQTRMGVIGILAYNRRIFQKIYELAARFACALSDGFVLFEQYLNAFFDYIGHAVIVTSSQFRKVSVGGINPYALVFTIGLIALLAYIYLVA